MKRFVKEFASYKKACITSNDLMLPNIKKGKILRIDHYLDYYQRALVTTDEIIRIISEI